MRRCGTRAGPLVGSLLRLHRVCTGTANRTILDCNGDTHPATPGARGTCSASLAAQEPLVSSRAPAFAACRGRAHRWLEARAGGRRAGAVCGFHRAAAVAGSSSTWRGKRVPRPIAAGIVVHGAARRSSARRSTRPGSRHEPGSIRRPRHCATRAQAAAGHALHRQSRVGLDQAGRMTEPTSKPTGRAHARGARVEGFRREHAGMGNHDRQHAVPDVLPAGHGPRSDRDRRLARIQHRGRAPARCSSAYEPSLAAISRRSRSAIRCWASARRPRCTCSTCRTRCCGACSRSCSISCRTRARRRRSCC